MGYRLLGLIFQFFFSPRQINPRHALVLFTLLQVYFLSNIFSFAFWESSNDVLLYMLAFFSASLVAFTLLLFLWLAASARFNLQRFDLLALVIFSLPVSYSVWLESIEVTRSLLYTVRTLLPFAILLVFLIGLPRIRLALGAILVLCGLSFVSHAEFSMSNGVLDEREAIALGKKTNIHVIAIDSLTNSAYSKVFMGVDNAASDYLVGLENTIYAGAMGFAEQVPTKRFWGALMNLDKTHTSDDWRAFSGYKSSYLTHLLRSNGYTISTGFSSNYFGDKGEYIDRYHINETHLKHSLICTWRASYLGLCSNFSNDLFELIHPSKNRSKWPGHVVELIERTEKDARGPQFSAYYIYKPIGHSSKYYRSDDQHMFAEYKTYFTREARNAQKVIEDIDGLRRRFPDSIFIITGDHGPYLSRTTPEEDRRYRVLDRHGVALALLNASNLCPWSRDWLARQRYLTPSRMVAASLACDGESRTLTKHFKDNEEFARFGESLAAAASANH